jgi:hypothetical protein
MPFPLHKVPLGLLGLLNLKTLGSNPNGFGEIVTPTADLRTMYGAPLHETFEQAGAETFVPTTTTMRVPQGEIWRVLAAGYLLNLGTGFDLTSNRIEAAISIGKPSATIGGVPVASREFDPGAAVIVQAFTFRMGIFFNEPPVLNSGHAIEGNLSFTSVAVAGTGITPILRAYVERIPL